MIIKVKDVEFITGARSMTTLPETILPEIAFVGRSNVGKSTLINRLTGRKKLARTSSTPGRTTELNFFKVTLVVGENEESSITKELYLVDLPGFGYAKFSKKERESLSKLTVNYITKREQLKAVCLLNDSRRIPEADEFAIRDITFSNDIHLLILLTKMDRLNQKEKNAQLKAIAPAYNLEAKDLILTGEKTPASDLWNRIISLL